MQKSLSHSANRNKSRLILVLQLVATGNFRSIIFCFDQHTRLSNYPANEKERALALNERFIRLWKTDLDEILPNDNISYGHYYGKIVQSSNIFEILISSTLEHWLLVYSTKSFKY